MSKKQEEKRMNNYLARLLQHLIKIHAQKSLNKSWINTISNCVKYIVKSGFEIEFIEQQIEEVWEDSLQWASEEVYNGISISDLNELIDKQVIKRECLLLIIVSK